MLKSIIKNNYKFCLSILIYIISTLYLSINKSYDLLSLLLLNTLFFIPLIIYFKSENKKKYQNRFPLFEIIVVLFFLTSFFIFYFDYHEFLFQFLYKDENINTFDQNVFFETKNKIISLTLKIYLISLIIFISSYYFFRLLLSKIKLGDISLFQNQSQILKIGYILYAGYLIMDINSYFKNVSVISELKILFIYTSLLIIFYSDNNYNKLIKYLLVFLLFVYLSLKTFVMPVISCTILILSIEWLIKNKINVVILMIFLLTFYFINLTKSFHRQNLEKYKYDTSSINFIENTKIFINYSSQKKTVKGFEFDKNQFGDVVLKPKGLRINQYSSAHQFQSLFRRISMSTQTLVHIIFYNDIAQSYEGKTLKFALYSLVPSVVWKNKPSFILANQFGRDFNFLYKDDYKTSINIPFITELYLNYYFKGIIIGMFLFALLISLIEFFISIYLNKDKIFSFILIASTFSFTYIETAAIFIVNGFVVKLAVLLIIIYCLKIILDNFNRLKVK